ncbi:RagB/SusD family nutrient uptake outer membrane protein [Geofilum sp. OHC36d9]|uniref:RagB/SusD family nutrient uptake outer membrane protein n=1 Tax=Geofilum sp. OHC36d9 TaxID=3458413 RepID=UPI00403480BE
MKKVLIIFIALVAVICFACEDVLDKRDLNKVDDSIWNEYSSAKTYINNIYADNMPIFSMASNIGYTDEGYSSNEAITMLMYGLVGDDGISYMNAFSLETFQLIRSINIAIKGIRDGDMNDDDKQLLLGQVLFFRAWRNWELVKLYGGIPLIFAVQDPYFDDFDVARSSTKASVEAIVSDLNNAITMLPARWDLQEDQGRITSGAAAAFKGRVLLAWASPMFSPDNNIDRWTDAYDANVDARKILDDNGYSLNPVFTDIFTDSPVDNPEAVMYRAYKSDTEDYINDWEASIRPPSGGGNMSYAPSWNLVKTFSMVNGKPISDITSGYDSVYFWRNRDPRFYATIGFNGCSWQMAGHSTNVLWTFNQYIGENRRTPATGFYCKKASNPTVTIENTGNTSTAWVEIRYAEVLMNLAECANEIGKTSVAVELLSNIRDRAGIDAAENYGLGSNLSIAQMRELIMNERAVEFAFENKRYWDLRRRKMFTEDLGPNTPKLNGSKRYGLIIDGNGVWKTGRVRTGEYAGWRRIDTAVYLGYVDIEREGDATTYFAGTLKEMDATLAAFGLENESAFINYQDLYYYFGISQSVLRRSPAIEQTKGWIYGTFDPLAE